MLLRLTMARRLHRRSPTARRSKPTASRSS